MLWEQKGMGNDLIEKMVIDGFGTQVNLDCFSIGRSAVFD